MKGLLFHAKVIYQSWKVHEIDCIKNSILGKGHNLILILIISPTIYKISLEEIWDWHAYTWLGISLAAAKTDKAKARIYKA